MIKDKAWVKSQTNRPLMSDYEAGVAQVIALEHGLPFHNERWKNWDSVIATYHTITECDLRHRVLDAGACRDPLYPSAYLPGLGRFGYSRRYGINLDEKERVIDDGVVYCHGDITKTSFREGSFSFVSCLSVIEHGVSVPDFIPEMARILMPGGHLFVSFDYWHDLIDCGDRMAFGAPVHVFDKFEVLDMIGLADESGLVLDSDFETTCGDRVVKWLGLEYTFMNLLFRRIDSSF